MKPPRTEVPALFFKSRARLRAPPAATMLLPLLLALVLVPSGRAQFAPPTVNISLDEDPAVRWDPLLAVFDMDFLRRAAAEVIE